MRGKSNIECVMYKNSLIEMATPVRVLAMYRIDMFTINKCLRHLNSKILTKTLILIRHVP